MDFWRHDSGEDKKGYVTWGLIDKQKGMEALRAMFPDAKADEMNFVFFSTSGVHGSYRTIEEEAAAPGTGVTFLVLQPRLVLTRYGVAFPKTEDDIAFLKELRSTSQRAMQRSVDISMPAKEKA